MQTLGKHINSPANDMLKVLDKNVLKAFVPLNTLSEDALEQLLDMQQVRSYQAGDILFNENDDNTTVAYLLSGEVRASKAGGSSEIISAADAAGWHPLSQGHCHTRTVQAEAPTMLLL